MHKPHLHLLPIEWAALAGTAVAVVLVPLFSLSFYFPDTHSSAFALEHYLLGILLSAVLLIFLRWRISKKMASAELMQLGRQMLALSLIVYLHFNLKLWAMLINPYRFDELYLAIDQSMAWLIRLIGFLNLGFTPIKTVLPDAYHGIFVGMFLATFLCFAATNRREAFEQSLLAVALVLIIGGLAYMPFPALGPFLYLSDVGSHADHIQQDMLGFMQRLIASNGQDYEGSHFIMPLAAMPSLHLAHAFVLLYYAWRHLRWLGYVYLPLFIFLISEAVVSRWHYLIDLPAGLLIAFLCIKIADSRLGNHGDMLKFANKKSV